MIASLSLGEGKTIKDIKELNYTRIKDIRDLFRQEKEATAIKDRILRDIKNLFDQEEEEKSYYKPVKVSNFWSNNYY